jgi:hypothetical protein
MRTSSEVEIKASDVAVTLFIDDVISTPVKGGARNTGATDPVPAIAAPARGESPSI